jgi:putative transposase
VRFFDPTDDVLITRQRLPHWSQAETVTFITWRTADSLPRAVIDQWREERTR